MRTVKTVLADDHRMLRQSWSISIGQLDYIKLVGEAKNGQEVIDLCEKEIINLVIMDVGMPIMDGWETTKIIKKRFPFTKVLIVSMFTQEKQIQKLLSAGAHGYISKDCTEEEFLEAVEVVADGGKYVSSDLQENLINNVANKEDNQSLIYQLSKRESEVVKNIMHGLSSKEIADILCISIKTVETHRSNIYKKLKIKNVVELMNTYKDKYFL
jgi:DNA-binding NarL/FixJ family response regulator